MNILISLIISVVSAVVSARVTLHYALKRFYFEKWWERKAEAYSSIFEALHHLKNHADHELAADKVVEPSLRPRVEKVLEELKEKMTGGIAEIRKRADIGAFVISEEAVSVLHTLLTELDESVTKVKISQTTALTIEDWRKHLNLRLSAINKCLESMRPIAEKDLKGPMTGQECFNRFWRAVKR